MPQEQGTLLEPGTMSQHAANYVQMKLDTLAKLPTILDQAVKALRSKKCSVFVADSPADAQAYIAQLVKDAQYVMLSTSRTTTEISIPAVLERADVEVIETSLDSLLGKVLGQGLEERELEKALKEKFGGKDWQEAVDTLRLFLRNYLLTCHYGITGTSAITADTGTLALLEDVGNLRGVANMSYTHIVVAGIDKVVPDLESAWMVARAASASRNGKDICTYFSLNTGPSQTGDIEGKLVHGMHGPKEVHIVLLDNGRSKMIEQGFSEALLCTGCNACSKVCSLATKQSGNAGLSGIDLIKTAFSYDINTARRLGLEQCDECGLCREVCLFKINIPQMIRRLKQGL